MVKTLHQNTDGITNNNKHLKPEDKNKVKGCVTRKKGLWHRIKKKTSEYFWEQWDWTWPNWKTHWISIETIGDCDQQKIWTAKRGEVQPENMGFESRQEVNFSGKAGISKRKRMGGEPNKIDFIKELAFDQQKLEKHHEGG